MKQKNREEFNCIKSYPQCIQWNLNDIPSLGIVNGDYLDAIIYAIANKLCELADPLDLASLSLQCLVDKLGNTDPVPRTIQNVLQLLIDNECTLKDLIDNLQLQIDTINTTNLILNLKCLAEFDAFGNPLPYTLQSVLQRLITELCTMKDEVIRLGQVVIDLQNQINNIPTTVYTLPVVSTCISASRPLDLSSRDIATSLCNLRNATGTEVQLQTAMAFQCSNFNAQFGNITGWNLAPVNLAQSYANMEIAVCDMLNRLVIMETTCCGPTCDKIKIGFGIEFDTDLKEITLNFTSGAGTVIPFGFYDCGSEISIHDEFGTYTYPASTVITQNGSITGINYSGLSGSIFTVSIKTKFCLKDREGNLILTCQDCISKVFDQTTKCPVCKVCVNGDKVGPPGKVEIIYTLNGSYQVLTIEEDQCNYLPDDAKVVAVTRFNGAEETSDCLDTTNTEVTGCYELSWSHTDNSNGQTEAWEDSNPSNFIRNFVVGTTIVPINAEIEDPTTVKSVIQSQVNAALIFGLGASQVNLAGNRFKDIVSFRAIPSIAETMYLTVEVDETVGIRIYPVKVECVTT